MRLDPSSSGHTFLNGTSLRTETYLTVKWDWISLPAAVWVLHVLLLAYTVWQTHREQMGPFKSSSLATIFAGLTEEKRVEVPGRIDTIQEMELAAKQLHVSLQNKDGEYRLG